MSAATNGQLSSGHKANRLQQFLRLILALVYFYVAWRFAFIGAAGLSSERWLPLVQAIFLAFLLLVGYAGFGIVFDRQEQPLVFQGFPRRAGFPGELGLGLAFGWALTVIAVLPLAFIGGIIIRLHLHVADWLALAADAFFFIFATLVEELVFRGYPFQKLIGAVGSLNAAILFAALYTAIQATAPGSTVTSTAVSAVFSLLLSMAYLRTRALWLSWGLNFAWKASRALLFGLTIAGVNMHSPVVVGDPMGPFKLTGGGFGLDGSWTALILLLIALPVLYRLTRDLNYQHNAPIIVPGGVPVELGGIAQHQHDSAMASTTAASPALVQIAPVQAPVSSATPEHSKDLPE